MHNSHKHPTFTRNFYDQRIVSSYFRFLLPIFRIFHFHFIQERLIRSTSFYWLLILVEDAWCTQHFIPIWKIFSYSRTFTNLYSRIIINLFARTFSIGSVRFIYIQILQTPSITFFVMSISLEIQPRSCIPSIAFAIIIKRIPRIYLTRLHKRERGGEEKFPSKKNKKKKKGRNVSGKRFSYLLRIFHWISLEWLKIF